MLQHLGINMPAKVVQRKPSELLLDLSKHWEQYDAHDPDYDISTAPQLINHCVPGYEGYQRRVGEMIMKQHRRIFG